MGALDDFLTGSKGVQPEDMAKKARPDADINNPQNFNAKESETLNALNKFYKAPEKKDERLQILQQELADEKAKLQAGDPRAQSNIDAINREINLISGKKTQLVAKPSGSALDDFLSGGAVKQQQAPAAPAKVSAEVRGGREVQQMPEQPAQPPSTMKKVGRSAAGLADTLIGGLQTLPGMALAETGYAGVRALEGLGFAEPGTAERGRARVYKEFVEPYARPVGEAFGVTQTPEYKGEASQQLMQFVGENISKGADWISQKTGIPKADIENMMATLSLAAPSAVKGAKSTLQAQFEAKKPPAPKIEPAVEKPKITYQELQAQLQRKKGKPFEINEQMAGVGAARTADKAMLDEAIARASPELKAELSKIKPGDINVEALNRVMDADQLDTPIRLTRGQATQDPTILSNELNSRAKIQEYAKRFNEQNAQLLENADSIKRKTAPDINTTSFVEDAENTIGRMSDRIKADDAQIDEAYKSLRNYGAGKLEVDSRSFADGALKALSEFDEQEFLPPSILNRINSYKEGKPMNFNQFENLRTVLARETRKANAANDGNMVHALTVVRSELEKMPLLNETAEAKVLADNARSLAKAQFDLLDKKKPTYNPLYADVMNGIADTKDFIPKLVFRSKNKDFIKTLETLSPDPESIKYLRSGALDYMIRESTTADGKFKSAKFVNFVNNLDVNKKLKPLFGENADELLRLANTGKLINARPAGSFVNESNTAVVAAQMAKQFGEKFAKEVPIVKSIIGPASQVIEQRRTAKEVKQTLKPAAGVRLSDIGKKK